MRKGCKYKEKINHISDIAMKLSSYYIVKPAMHIAARNGIITNIFTSHFVELRVLSRKTAGTILIHAIPMSSWSSSFANR